MSPEATVNVATDTAKKAAPIPVSSAPVPSTANHGLPSQSVAGAFKADMNVVAPESHSISEAEKKKLSSQLANLHGQASKVFVRQGCKEVPLDALRNERRTIAWAAGSNREHYGGVTQAHGDAVLQGLPRLHVHP